MNSSRIHIPPSDGSTEIPVERHLTLELIGDQDLDDSVELGLRPLDHRAAPSNSSLSDLQTVENQLRFYTAERCLRQFRAVGRHLRQNGVNRPTTVVLAGEPTAGDWQFIRVLSDFIELRWEMSCESTRHGWNAEAGSQDLDACLNVGDSWTGAAIADQLVVSGDIGTADFDSVALAFGLQGRLGDCLLALQRWSESGEMEAARAKYSLA